MSPISYIEREGNEDGHTEIKEPKATKKELQSYYKVDLHRHIFILFTVQKCENYFNWKLDIFWFLGDFFSSLISVAP